MKKCFQCGSQLPDNALFCTVCGNCLNSENNHDTNDEHNNSMHPITESAQTYMQQNFQPATAKDNKKAYSILAHISILWLFGLLAVPEKFDARVRFNVGQGIIATIVGTACSIIATILTVINNSVFREEISYFGYGTGTYTTSAVAGVLNTLIWLAVSGIIVFYMIYGIVKVSKNNDSYLPIIGKLAFYK